MDPKVAAVLGNPVSHSLSPVVFSYISKKIGKDLQYNRLEIPEDQLRKTLEFTRSTGYFLGWNVTIPYKEAIVKASDWQSPEVKLLGAANVVHFNRKRIQVHNTDVMGIQETLREQKFAVRGKKACLYGAGGAARAVGYVLGQFGAEEVAVVNRSLPRAKKFVQSFNKKFPKTKFRAVAQDSGRSIDAANTSLWINSTPLGMKGFLKGSLLHPNAPRGALAFDLVYVPEKTRFLSDAKKRGLKTVNGLDMFVWQAIGTWEIWFGRISSRDKIKKSLKLHLKKEHL